MGGRWNKGILKGNLANWKVSSKANSAHKELKNGYLIAFKKQETDIETSSILKNT